MQRAKELLPIIQAFSEGKVIECTADGTYWERTNHPQWYQYEEYRITKEKSWYRLALFITGVHSCNFISNETVWQEKENFIRWLTPRIEYDVE